MCVTRDSQIAYLKTKLFSDLLMRFYEISIIRFNYPTTTVKRLRKKKKNKSITE